MEMHFLIATLLLIIISYVFFPTTLECLTENMFSLAWGGHNRLALHFNKHSVFCKSIIQRCSLLSERYNPPLWGYFGHLQTFLFSTRNVLMPPPCIKGVRQYLKADDGSTVTYDLFEPSASTAKDEVIMVLPGIGNTAESDYVMSLCNQATGLGYHVAVLNHTGCLDSEQLTGNRIFTYGGTGDCTLMFNDLESKFSSDTKFIGLGFSMGGLVLVRFLGELCLERQRRFMCAVSIGQGYCSQYASKIVTRRWEEMKGLYHFGMTKKILKLLKRHKEQIYTNHPLIKRRSSVATSSEGSVSSNGSVTPNEGVRNSASMPCLSEERDSNGFPVDPDKIVLPDDRMWTANSFAELDEYYTRRIMGFESYGEFKKWVSCVDHLYRIQDLPFLLVNAFDDPIIPKQLIEIPIKYTEFNRKALFVGTKHGGHCGFYEGGWMIPNEITWSDRLIFQYIEVCKQEI